MWAMTDKELKKLSRAELLEMLIAQSKKLSRVEEELAKAKEELEKREIALSDSGTLAEAALKLNGIFEDADRAAKQYLDTLKAQNENADRLMVLARKKAEEILKDAQEQKLAMIKEAEQQVKERTESFNKQLNELLKANLT